MCLTAVLLISAMTGWGPADMRFDTAYSLELDEQYDEAKKLYQEAVTSSTEPLEAHLGLIRVADKDPLETVPVYPPNSSDSLAHFLHLLSTEVISTETGWVKWEGTRFPMHDTFLKNLIDQYPSIPHPRLMLAHRMKWDQRDSAIRLLDAARDTFLGHPIFDRVYVEMFGSGNLDGLVTRARMEARRLIKFYSGRPLQGFFEYKYAELHNRTREYDTILARTEPGRHRWGDDILLARAESVSRKKDTEAASHLCRMVLDMGWNNSVRGAASLLATIYADSHRETEAIELLADYERQYGGRYQSLGYRLVRLAKDYELPDTDIVEYCRLALVHAKPRGAAYSDENMIRRQLAAALLRSNRTGEAVEQIETLRAEAKSKFDKFAALTLLYRAHLQMYPSVLTAWFMTYVLAVLVFPLALIYFLRLPGLTGDAKIAGTIVVIVIFVLEILSTPGRSVEFWGWTIFSALRNFVIVAASVTLLASSAIPLRLNWTACLETAGFTLAGGLWTYGLYEIRQPEVSHVLKAILEDLPSEFGIPVGRQFGWHQSVAYVTSGALTEELLCRLLPVAVAVRSFGDSRRPQILALAIATVVWAAAHAGMVIPEWWKFAQIVGIGIFLSALFLRRGVVACMIAHASFNIAAVFLND